MSALTRVNPKLPSTSKIGDEREPEEDITPVERVLRTIIDGVLHYLPQIIILIACIPLLLIVSLVAGWIVRNSVPRGWERRVFLRYGESSMPTAHFDLPTLVPDQAYDISVHLTIPLTDSNVALGNVMTYLTFTDAENKTVASAHRPVVVLPPPSHPFVFKLLPFSSRPQTTLVIPLLTYWKPLTSSYLSGILEVGRRDSWTSIGTGQGRELTVIEAYVRGAVQLEGTRRVVGTYPNIAGIVSSGIFFATAMLGLVICFWRYAAPFEGGGVRRGAKGPIAFAAGAGGRPLPPKPMPTFERRRRTWKEEEEDDSTRRGYVKQEMSPSLSASSMTGDLPTTPTPDSVIQRQQSSDAFVDVTTDEESPTISP